MATDTLGMIAPTGQVSDVARETERHWLELARQRSRATAIGCGLMLVFVVASLWFANESNAGKFLDRLPNIGDFVSWLWPEHWPDVWRAMLDLPSPNADGTFRTDYEIGRVYLVPGIYIPEYVFKLIETVNIALLSTIIGFALSVPLAFLAASNMSPFGPLRFVVRRVLEFLRAFPEIVIAVLFAAVLSVGPVPAIIAVAAHTIGALGKLFYEVIENASMKANEGLASAGASWLQRVRFAMLPQVLPNFLSYGLLRLEVNVRQSTIIGAVGGGGIGQELMLAIKRGYGSKAIAMMILLFVTVMLIDRLSGFLRMRLVGYQSLISR
ncbi:MAG: phosphonate ABC transporter, permease protein PhnE [Hyphomicrobiaceae bacterium]